MKIEDCYFLGKVTKSHGIKGEVIIWLDVDDPNLYEDMDSVFLLQKGELVPFFIEELQIRGKKSIALFEDFEKVEDTAAIINCEMYLPIENLPEMPTNGFYYHEVIGYEVYDNLNGHKLGILKSIYESTGQDLIAFDMQQKEVLVPIADEIIAKVDQPNRAIYLNLPDGLLDIYLKE